MPRFGDLDGDGIVDLVSGSYTAGISFFRGVGDGTFAAEAKVTRDGKPLLPDEAQSACIGDWTGDGRLDIVIGVISGPVTLFRNLGGMTFSEGAALTAEGEPIKAHDGGPCLADWDGDGILDLILGDEEGHLTFYRGKVRGGTDLEAGVPLLPTPRPGSGWQPAWLDPDSPTGLNRTRPALRLKPWVADWNGDGKLDLLVGDYLQLVVDGEERSPDAKALRRRLGAELETVLDTLEERKGRARAEALQRTGLAESDLTGESERERFQAAYDEALTSDEEYRTLQSRREALQEELQPLQSPAESSGFVWVYLRK